ncbi:unnamed protein product [Caenorhabditis auriculariae]|uniref:Calpain catalytic domain-containing protein n=1 Tax=Caenorhabditis auriculariae TaxID=2777116 RepID=A0A8S1HMF6_9PELO|nr:unnamed protein product [Caenorhabditis auriculariae]
MSDWSCEHCTLINKRSSKKCVACGWENATRKTKNLLPKFISKQVNDFSNAIGDIFSSQLRPNNNIVPSTSSSAYKPRVPDGPLITKPVPQDIPSNSPSLPRIPEQNGSVHSPHRGGLPYDPARPLSTDQLPNTSFNTSALSDSSMCSETAENVQRSLQNESEQNFLRISEFCKSTNTHFIDDSFPHSQKSIGELERESEGAVVGHAPKTFVWIHPSNMFTKDGRAFRWSVFNDPRPSDIEQGSLGDCWLLSAMALIAERPDILESIFLTKEYNPMGIYQLRLCVDGLWIVVLVDDFFPCRPDSLSLAFAVGRKNQMWVPLIEKALAKQFGSYAALSAGRTVEGLAILTGASCETHSTQDLADTDILWASLLSSREAGYIMGCSCGAGRISVDPLEYKAKGLLARHAYSILDVVQESGIRLLRLRNPWGNFVWQGKWSDVWSGWPPEMKNRLLREHETGTFWIEFSEFIQYFDSVDIAKVHSQNRWSELRVPVKMSGKFSPVDRALLIIVTDNTEISLTLFQKDSRKLRDQNDVLICVHKVSASHQIGDLVAESPRKIASFVSTADVFLKPGQYVAICHSILSLGGKSVEGSLVVYSSRPLFGEPIFCHPEMYTDSLTQLVAARGTPVGFSISSGAVIRQLAVDFAGMLIMADNLLENTWLHVGLNCSDSVNVLSSRGTLNVADVIPPLSRQILIVLTHFEPSSFFRVSNQIRVTMSRNLGLRELALPDRRGVVNKNAVHTPDFEGVEQATLHKTFSLLR